MESITIPWTKKVRSLYYNRFDISIDNFFMSETATDKDLQLDDFNPDQRKGGSLHVCTTDSWQIK